MARGFTLYTSHGDYIMPRKTSNTSQQKNAGDFWQGFIRCEFDAQSRSAYDLWSETANLDDCYSELMAIVESDGLKLSISYNPSDRTWMIGLTGGVTAPPQYKGWTLNARAGSWERALLALHYKHFVLLEMKWTSGIAADGPRDEKWVG